MQVCLRVFIESSVLMPVHCCLPHFIFPAVRNAVQQRWQRVHGSEQRWEVLKEIVEEEAKVGWSDGDS